MINKRGQEGVSSWGVIVGIILLAVVVIVVILFFTGTFDKLTEGRGALPETLAIIAQSCKISATNNLVTDYCYTFKDAGGDEFVNCEDPRIQSELSTQQVDVSQINCDDSLVTNAKKNVCDDASTGDRNDISFNNGESDCSAFPTPTP